MRERNDQPVGVGVIGLGFMGATHVAAYLSAAQEGYPCRLVAVCDNKAARREGFFADVGGNIGTAPGAAPVFDAAQVRGYESADDLLRDRDVDLVSICTHTDTHAELAIRALRAGKHVLVEKPVALTADAVRPVQQAAREAGRLCMPAMCMRFWPGWDWLKQRIDEGSFGRCTALTLTRLGSMPAWATTFYTDPARCGGALIDLHVHDADFVLYCFGRPSAVWSAGHERGGMVDHVTTIYRYERPGAEAAPAHVVAEGAWLAPPSPFRMRYVAAFEGATVDYDLGREQPLVVYRNGRAEPVELPKGLGYDQEIRHLVSAIAAGTLPLRATIDDAVAVAEVLDAERRSIEQRQVIQL